MNVCEDKYRWCPFRMREREGSKAGKKKSLSSKKDREGNLYLVPFEGPKYWVFLSGLTNMTLLSAWWHSSSRKDSECPHPVLPKPQSRKHSRGQDRSPRSWKGQRTQISQNLAKSSNHKGHSSSTVKEGRVSNTRWTAKLIHAHKEGLNNACQLDPLRDFGASPKSLLLCSRLKWEIGTMCAGQVLDTATRQKYKPLGHFQVEHFGPLWLSSSRNFLTRLLSPIF